jgi:MFS family permease
MQGTWRTTSSGSGLGTAILVIVVAALAVSAAPAVAGAAASLITAALWTVGIVAAAAVTGGAAYAVYRWRHPRRELPLQAQATIVRPAAAQLPPAAPPAIENHVHHHWHGVSAEEVAAILRRQEGR